MTIIVTFGSMLCLTQSLSNAYFKCENQTLSQLNFQLRNRQGEIVKLSSRWSFSIILMRANDYFLMKLYMEEENYDTVIALK